MRVFIYNFTYIERRVKCRGKKIYLPKAFESKISKPRFISNYLDLARAENISMNLGSINSTFQHLGK